MDCIHLFSTVLPNWLVAIGTIGAVITSLWFSHQSNKIKAKGSANYMEEWTIPPGLVRQELVLLKIINTGKVPFVIQSIHFESLPKAKYSNMLMLDPSYGLTNLPLPARLEYSEEFILQLPKDALEKILEKEPDTTSLSFYALTKLDERIDLKTGPQLSEFIGNWKAKQKEVPMTDQETV